MKLKFTVGADFFRAVRAFAAVTGNSVGFANRALTLCISRKESWAWGVNGVCETFAEFVAQGAPEAEHCFQIDAVRLAKVIGLAKVDNMLVEVEGRQVTVSFDDQHLVFDSLAVEELALIRPTKTTTSVVFSSDRKTFHEGIKFMEHVLDPTVASQFLWFKGGKMFSSSGTLVRSCSFPPCQDMPFALSVADTQKLLSYMDLYDGEESAFAYVDTATRKFLYITTSGADFRSYLKILASFETQRTANPLINVVRDSEKESEWNVAKEELAFRLSLFTAVAEEDAIEIDKPPKGPLDTDHPSALLRIRSTQGGKPSEGRLLITEPEGVEQLKPFRIDLKILDRYARDVANGDDTLHCNIYNNKGGRCLVMSNPDKTRQALVLTYKEGEDKGKA